MTDLDLSALIGTWTNTETRWQWIRSVEIRNDGKALALELRGGVEPSPRSWRGSAERVYAASPEGTAAEGFRAVFRHERMRSEVQATLNQGLMVLVSFNDVLDGGAGPSRVTREFFARTDGRP